jgi:NAD(P)-dependent dehydrogenase (short-subunit alcohol dehydrogenase family)
VKNNNNFDFSNRSYLITGAASGIGRELAIILSNFGAKLLLLDKDFEGLENTAKDCKEVATAIACDLTSGESILDLVKPHIATNGKLNGFVHCAGRPHLAPLKNIDRSEALETYLINSYAGLELAKACSNRYIFAGDAGSFIYISSVYGMVGSSANASYAMSKSALHGLVKSLAVELAVKNIRVNSIVPGFIKTNMLSEVSLGFGVDYLDNISNLHLLGLGSAEDIANAAIFLLSDMSRWITGIELVVDGGFTVR